MPDDFAVPLRTSISFNVMFRLFGMISLYSGIIVVSSDSTRFSSKTVVCLSPVGSVYGCSSSGSLAVLLIIGSTVVTLAIGSTVVTLAIGSTVVTLAIGSTVVTLAIGSTVVTLAIDSSF